MVQILFPRSLVRSLPFFDIGLELLKLLYRYHCLPGRQTGQAAISGCYRQDCTLCRFAQVLYLSSELTRMACEYPTCRILLVEDFLQLQDGGCWIPFAALFLFSQYTRDGAGRRLFTSGSANRNHWGCCWCLSRSKWYVQFPLQKFSILIHTELPADRYLRNRWPVRHVHKASCLCVVWMRHIQIHWFQWTWLFHHPNVSV
jgi:hypothetical protein